MKLFTDGDTPWRPGLLLTGAHFNSKVICTLRKTISATFVHNLAFVSAIVRDSLAARLKTSLTLSQQISVPNIIFQAQASNSK